MNVMNSKENARKALRQHRMETAIEFGMSHEEIFDIVENSYNNPIITKKINLNKKNKSNTLPKYVYLE